MSILTEPDSQVAKEFANQIVLQILPRYPVMGEASVRNTIKQPDSPICKLLWYIGEVLWYYSEFEEYGQTMK